MPPAQPSTSIRDKVSNPKFSGWSDKRLEGTYAYGVQMVSTAVLTCSIYYDAKSGRLTRTFFVLQANWRKAQKEENAMLAAKKAAGEPLPERRYTHATKPKPTFLKHLKAPKFPQKAQQQPASGAQPAAVNVTSTANQSPPSIDEQPASAPPAPASPDSAAAKPASIAAQDSVSSSESDAKHENGVHAVVTGRSEVPSSQSNLRGSRKALFTDEDGQQSTPTAATGQQPHMSCHSCMHVECRQCVQLGKTCFIYAKLKSYFS